MRLGYESGTPFDHLYLCRRKQVGLSQLQPLGLGIAMVVIDDLFCYGTGRCIDRDLQFGGVMLRIVEVLRIQEDLGFLPVHKHRILHGIVGNGQI